MDPKKILTNRIEDPLHKFLFCPLSQQPLAEPVSVDCCGNLFEKEMLQKSLEGDNRCPLCRSEAPTIQKAPLVLAQTIAEIIDNDPELKANQYEVNIVSSLFNPFNYSKMKKYYTQFPEKINDFYAEERNPLITFASRGYNKSIQFAINIGADIDCMSPKSGLTPLMHAIAYNKMGSFEYLINLGANLNHQCGNGFFYYLAPGYDSSDEDEEEREYKYESSSPLATALHLAVLCDRPDMCRKLIAAGANLYLKNQAELTPKELAEQEGNQCEEVFNEAEALFQFILQSRIENNQLDIDLMDNLIEESMENEDGEELMRRCEELLKSYPEGPDLLILFSDCQKGKILTQFKRGKFDTAIAMLKKTNFIDDILDPSVGSAIMFLARAGHLNGVKSLIARGANINQKNEEGFTALMYAIQGNHSDVVQYLLKAGAHFCLNNKACKMTTSFIVHEDIRQQFTSAQNICRMIEESSLKNHNVTETLIDLYAQLKTPILFLKKFMLLSSKISAPLLRQMASDLLDMEKMRENLNLLQDINKIEPVTDVSSSKRTTFFFQMSTWSNEVSSLLNQLNTAKSGREFDFAALRMEYHRLLNECPPESVCFLEELHDLQRSSSNKKARMTVN